MPSHEPCCGTMFWVFLTACVGLVMFAGLMSGLTLGLMSLSLVDLEVLAKAGTPKDKLNAGNNTSNRPTTSDSLVIILSNLRFRPSLPLPRAQPGSSPS